MPKIETAVSRIYAKEVEEMVRPGAVLNGKIMKGHKKHPVRELMPTAKELELERGSHTDSRLHVHQSTLAVYDAPPF